MKPRGQGGITREISRIRRSFSTLANAFARLGPALSSSAARPSSNGRAAATKSGRKRPRLSAAQRAALKLQGKYMGTMRGLKRADQSRVKAIRKTKGIRAAIAEAQRLAAR